MSLRAGGQEMGDRCQRHRSGGPRGRVHVLPHKIDPVPRKHRPTSEGEPGESAASGCHGRIHQGANQTVAGRGRTDYSDISQRGLRKVRGNPIFNSGIDHGNTKVF